MNGALYFTFYMCLYFTRAALQCLFILIILLTVYPFGYFNNTMHVFNLSTNNKAFHGHWFFIVIAHLYNLIVCAAFFIDIWFACACKNVMLSLFCSSICIVLGLQVCFRCDLFYTSCSGCTERPKWRKGPPLVFHLFTVLADYFSFVGTSWTIFPPNLVTSIYPICISWCRKAVCTRPLFTSTKAGWFLSCLYLNGLAVQRPLTVREIDGRWLVYTSASMRLFYFCTSASKSYAK